MRMAQAFTARLHNVLHNVLHMFTCVIDNTVCYTCQSSVFSITHCVFECVLHMCNEIRKSRYYPRYNEIILGDRVEIITYVVQTYNTRSAHTATDTLLTAQRVDRACTMPSSATVPVGSTIQDRRTMQAREEL